MFDDDIMMMISECYIINEDLIMRPWHRGDKKPSAAELLGRDWSFDTRSRWILA